MINVLLVDDHELVRTGIKRLLNDVEDIHVQSEASSGEEALELVRSKRPDVVLMDVNMPGIGGLEATRRLLNLDPSLQVIIVTVHTEDPFPSHLLQAGAVGYLSKGTNMDEMVQAIRDVHNGKRYISPEIAQKLALSMLPGSDASPFDKLSQRELQVLYMLIQGDKVQAISDKLCLSPKTVSTYRSRLLDKLGVRNDAELTRLAMRYGMLEGIT